MVAPYDVSGDSPKHKAQWVAVIDHEGVSQAAGTVGCRWCGDQPGGASARCDSGALGTCSGQSEAAERRMDVGAISGTRSRLDEDAERQAGQFGALVCAAMIGGTARGESSKG